MNEKTLLCLKTIKLAEGHYFKNALEIVIDILILRVFSVFQLFPKVILIRISLLLAIDFLAA